MKILHITPSFQHPTMRGPSRHYHFVRELANRHQITLLSLSRSQVSVEAFDEMACYADRTFIFQIHAMAGDTDRPTDDPGTQVSRRIRQALGLQDAVSRMKRTFNNLIRQESFDVILFHGKPVYPVIEACDELPIVADFCDATSMRIQQKMSHASMARYPFLMLRYLQVRHIEKQLVAKTPFRAFISARDRDAIMGPEDRSEIVPNGVDHSYWSRSGLHQPQENCLVFSGVMDYAPNEDAAMYLMDRVLPLVRCALPDVRVLIVGRNPSARLVEKASQQQGITVTGRVDDMRPFLERGSLCVAPMRIASGTQNKILEALAMELPVVTTPVAAEGIRMDGEASTPVAIAEGEVGFAESVIHLLRDPEERMRLAQEGRHFVEKHFSWARSAEKLEEMCFESVSSSARR